MNGGHTNASEFCQVMFKAPTFDMLLQAFTNQQVTDRNINLMSTLAFKTIAEEDDESLLEFE